MRALIGWTCLVAVVLMGGTYAPGRSPAADMVLAGYSDDAPSPTHLGHWLAPGSGRPVALAANVMESGSGAGAVTFGVMVEGAGTVCTLQMPCTAAPADFPGINCSDTSIPAAAPVHIEFSHTCAVAPRGNLVASFEWMR